MNQLTHTFSNPTNHSIAIVVPYRDRLDQLGVFLSYMHLFLKNQNVNYWIYIINQADQNPFNRAKLLNVGFVEASMDFNWTCFIFHDVDLLPKVSDHLYKCHGQPHGMNSVVEYETYDWYAYAQYFGGVSSILSEQFRKVNGYSNSYWGWGGEDDDMFMRLSHHNLSMTRSSTEIGRYKRIHHGQEHRNEDRWNLLDGAHSR